MRARSGVRSLEAKTHGGQLAKGLLAPLKSRTEARLKKENRVRDDNGEWTEAGDTIYFSHGIPPVHVTATIINRNGT